MYGPGALIEKAKLRSCFDTAPAPGALEHDVFVTLSPVRQRSPPTRPFASAPNRAEPTRPFALVSQLLSTARSATQECSTSPGRAAPEERAARSDTVPERPTAGHVHSWLCSPPSGASADPAALPRVFDVRVFGGGGEYDGDNEDNEEEKTNEEEKALSVPRNGI